MKEDKKISVEEAVKIIRLVIKDYKGKIVCTTPFDEVEQALAVLQDTVKENKSMYNHLKATYEQVEELQEERKKLQSELKVFMNDLQKQIGLRFKAEKEVKELRKGVKK